jgi:enamine deaminase RidA (YjgF/YER057c/UK114 family)
MEDGMSGTWNSHTPIGRLGLGMAALAIVGTATALAQGGRSVIQRLNPPGLSTPNGYAHVVSARGGRTIYIAGQLARDAEGRTVGVGDFAAQTRQVFANLDVALKAAGASFDDVVKMNTYVRDAGQVQVVRDVRAKHFTKGLPASTLVEVSRLASPEFLIEIEVVAVVAE